MLSSIDFNPEKMFILFVLIFGLGFLFFVPPFQAPDEYQHFSRAYVVSEGHLFTAGGQIPRAMLDFMGVTQGVPFHPDKKVNLADLIAWLDKPLYPAEKVPIDFPASAVYSPLPYLVSALGIYAGRTLGASPLIIFYLGRLFNLLVWALLAYWALRLTPIYKWTFLLLFLSPMSLSQAASFSADSLTNGLSFLAIAYCLYLALTVDRPLNLKDVLPLFALALLLPFTKPPYVVLIGGLFLIPLKKWGSLKKYALVSSILIISAVILIILGSSINREYYYRFVPYPGVNASDQIAYMLHHPFGYIKTLLRTIYHDFGFMARSYVGILGWLDTELPRFIYLSFYLVVLFVALVEARVDMYLSHWQKIILALIAAFTFLMVATGQYITWTPVAEPKINAIQGRYLIPIGPPLVLLFYNHRFKVRDATPRYLVLLYLGLILTVTIRTVFLRYYQV